MKHVPVQLTAEERAERGLQLAQAIHERAFLIADHADRAQYMRQELKRLEQQIATLADVVRTGTEWRSALQLELEKAPEAEP